MKLTLLTSYFFVLYTSFSQGQLPENKLKFKDCPFEKGSDKPEWTSIINTISSEIAACSGGQNNWGENEISNFLSSSLSKRNEGYYKSDYREANDYIDEDEQIPQSNLFSPCNSSNSLNMENFNIRDCLSSRLSLLVNEEREKQQSGINRQGHDGLMNGFNSLNQSVNRALGSSNCNDQQKANLISNVAYIASSSALKYIPGVFGSITSLSVNLINTIATKIRESKSLKKVMENEKRFTRLACLAKSLEHSRCLQKSEKKKEGKSIKCEYEVLDFIDKDFLVYVEKIEKSIEEAANREKNNPEVRSATKFALQLYGLLQKDKVSESLKSVIKNESEDLWGSSRFNSRDSQFLIDGISQFQKSMDECDKKSNCNFESLNTQARKLSSKLFIQYDLDAIYRNLSTNSDCKGDNLKDWCKDDLIKSYIDQKKNKDKKKLLNEVDKIVSTAQALSPKELNSKQAMLAEIGNTLFLTRLKELGSSLERTKVSEDSDQNAKNQLLWDMHEERINICHHLARSISLEIEKGKTLVTGAVRYSKNSNWKDLKKHCKVYDCNKNIQSLPSKDKDLVCHNVKLSKGIINNLKAEFFKTNGRSLCSKQYHL